MNNPVILSLSDFHIRKQKDTNHDDAVDDFCTNLENHITDNREWKPNFICISGDIAFSGDKKEFEQGQKIIQKICDACDVNPNNVIMSIGNHDMTAQIKPEKIIDEKNIKRKSEEKQKQIRAQRMEYETYLNSYFSALDSLLANPSSLKKNDDVRDRIIPVFKEYSSFRKKFISDKSKYYGSYFFEGTDIDCLIGYRCFEQERVLFWELNNTWMSLPYDNNIHRTYNMKFGTYLVNEFRSKIDNLRKEGYFVVTIFHQPLHLLTHSEYQPSGGNLCAYDTIIGLSDICLSGHEHGPETKHPDCLGNSAQYFLNGGFYAWEENRLDCSAALIRIDRENDIIQKKQMYYDVRDHIWRYPKISSVPIASSFYKKDKRSENIRNYKFEYKKIASKSDLMGDKNTLHSKLIAQYFGNKFDLMGDFLQKNGNEQNEYQICFINVQDVESNGYELNFNKSLITFVLCYAPLEMFPKAESIYMDIKKKYEADILQGHLLFTMTKIEKL